MRSDVKYLVFVLLSIYVKKGLASYHFLFIYHANFFWNGFVVVFYRSVLSHDGLMLFNMEYMEQCSSNTPCLKVAEDSQVLQL